MKGLVLVYTLFGSAEEAHKVARQLVTEKLAGCVNILPRCTSIYQWQGEMQEDGETPVLLKTRMDQRERLMTRLAELHSYEVPAILSWDIESAPDYVRWLSGQVL